MDEALKEFQRSLKYVPLSHGPAPYPDLPHRKWTRIQDESVWSNVYVNGYLQGTKNAHEIFGNMSDTECIIHPLQVFSQNNVVELYTTDTCSSEYRGNGTRTVEINDDEPDGNQLDGISNEMLVLYEVVFSGNPVYFVTPENVNATRFLEKYFPWYQTTLALEPVCSTTLQSAADVLDNGGEALLNPPNEDYEEPQGCLQLLKNEAKKRKPTVCQSGDDDDDYGVRYKEFQRWCCASFGSRCWTPGAKLSKPGESIRKWSVENGQDDGEGPQAPQKKILFSNLSPFGNMMLQWNAQWEKVFFLLNHHIIMSMLMMGRLNAYKQKKELHFNFLATGPGATSKSFMFELLEDLSIPGTIDKLTYQTTASDAVDDDQNDQISVFHECPSTFFVTNDKGDQAENRLKTRLTECCVNAKVFQVDEKTQKRSNRVTKNQCIGSFIGATNESPDTSKAVISRMFLWMVDKKERNDCTMTGVMSARAGLEEENEQVLIEAKYEHNWFQYATFLVEKYIFIGAIKDVDMSVGSLIIRRCCEILINQKIQAKHPRDLERIKLLARSMTIVSTLYEVYCLSDKPFNTDTLTDIEPYLICTEEIALCAFGMMSTQYVRPKESNIIQTMCDKTMGCTPHYKMADTGDVDARYIEIEILGAYTEDARIKKLAKIVSTTTNIGQNNIEIILKSLTCRSVRSPMYISNNNVIDKQSIGIDHQHPTECIQCLTIEVEKVYVATHVWLMILDGHDIIAETIDKSQHAGSRNETFIIGRPMSRYPQLIDSVNRAPTNERIMYNNEAAMDIITQECLGGVEKFSTLRNVDSSVQIHQHDLEQTAFETRLDSLGYNTPVLQYRIKDNPRVYPDAYVTELTGYLARQKRTREEAGLGEN